VSEHPDGSWFLAVNLDLDLDLDVDLDLTPVLGLRSH
jgi:hypothetical protein